MKKIFLLVFFFLFLASPFSFALAKKLLPQAQPARSTSTATKSRGAVSVVKFRSDRRAVILTLSSLLKFKRVDYLLSYTTPNGLTQGASGSIISSPTDSITRELLFGSCSKGVCRYDTNITNAKLQITTYLTGGLKVIKNYKLKV